MTQIVKILFLIFSSYTIGVESQYGVCTVQNYNYCVERLRPLLDGETSFYVKVSVDRMKALCQEYRFVRTCLDQFVNNCTNDLKYHIKSTHDHYEYICDQTFEVFARHRDCIASPELDERAESCNNTFINALITPGTGSVCGHQRAYLDCLSAEVSIKCGAEAGNWQQGLDKATFQPLLTPYGCNLDMDSRAYCTKNNVDHCFSPLEDHPIEEGRKIVPVHSEGNITAICNTYKQVRPCIDLLLFDCRGQATAHLTAIQDHYQYVCDDNFQGYLQHRGCLETPELINEGAHCEKYYDNAVLNPTFAAASPEFQADRICQHMNTYIDCKDNLVASFCGKAAANWQRGLDKALYDPLLAQYNCQIEPKDYNQIPIPATTERATPSAAGHQSTSSSNFSPAILIGVILPIIVIIFGITLGICLYVCLRKKRSDTSHQRMTNDTAYAGQNQNASTRVVYTVPPQPEVLPQDLGATGTTLPMPLDILPPAYSEKPALNELLAAAVYANYAYEQEKADEVKVPMPPDDGYETAAGVSRDGPADVCPSNHLYEVRHPTQAAHSNALYDDTSTPREASPANNPYDEITVPRGSAPYGT